MPLKQGRGKLKNVVKGLKDSARPIKSIGRIALEPSQTIVFCVVQSICQNLIIFSLREKKLFSCILTTLKNTDFPKEKNADQKKSLQEAKCSLERHLQPDLGS